MWYKRVVNGITIFVFEVGDATVATELLDDPLIESYSLEEVVGMAKVEMEEDRRKNWDIWEEALNVVAFYARKHGHRNAIIFSDGIWDMVVFDASSETLEKAKKISEYFDTILKAYNRAKKSGDQANEKYFFNCYSAPNDSDIDTCYENAKQYLSSLGDKK